MATISKAMLTFSVFVVTAAPAMAAFWECDVPEIDGSAGVAAIAVLASAGIIAYQRHHR